MEPFIYKIISPNIAFGGMRWWNHAFLSSMYPVKPTKKTRKDPKK